MSSASASDRPKLPETFEADAWGKLQACVRAVHQQQPVDQSFEELYKAVEDLWKENDLLREQVASLQRAAAQHELAARH